MSRTRNGRGRAWIVLSLFVALAPMVIWSSAQAGAAEPAEGDTTMKAKMMERCKEMMGQKQKMMGEMKAQDAALAEQVAKMNAAPEDKKVGLMAAVLTQMVEQQAAMHARMAKKQDEMMGHMMQHMQMGKESMSQCPMMKGMKGMMKGTDPEAGDAPKERQDKQE